VAAVIAAVMAATVAVVAIWQAENLALAANPCKAKRKQTINPVLKNEMSERNLRIACLAFGFIHNKI
jgi:hypothetical protein